LEGLALCAQQVAEKTIVAVLVHLWVEFPYVHDLAALLVLVDQAGMAVPDDVAQPGRITPGQWSPSPKRIAVRRWPSPRPWSIRPRVL